MNRIEGDVTVEGRLIPKFLTVPEQAITDAGVAADAEIGAEKLEHQHRAVYARESGTVAADEVYVVHVVRGATGTVEAFEAGSVIPCAGNATISVDLLVNGTSILQAPIVLDSTNSSRVVEIGTITAAALVDGDVLEIAVTTAAGLGTLGSGLFAAATIHEEAD